MKKILFLSHSSGHTGSPVVLYDIVKNISGSEYKSLTIFPADDGITQLWEDNNIAYKIIKNPEISFKQIGINKYPWLIFNRISYFLKLFAVMCKNDFDVIYINSAVNVLGGIIGWILRKKVIWHLHESFMPTGINKIKGGVIGFCSSKIIFASPTCKNLIPSKYHSKSEVIFNGVDIKRFTLPNENSVSLLESFGINKENILIIFIGYLSKIKGIDTLIESAKILSQKNDRIKFLIVGDTPETSKEYGKYIRDLVNDYNLNDRVIFSGFRKDIPELLKISDIFVLPSRNEACPVCLIEAMAAGKPIIATCVGCVEELIDYGKAAIMISPENPEELADKILLLINDKSKCKEISQYAQSRAKDFFDKDIFIKSILSILKKI